MAIINYRTGKTLTARQMKAYVMQQRGITSDEYNKLYDQTRNRVRNYETITGQKLSFKVNELIYQQTKSEARYGADYSPSLLIRNIMDTTSASPSRIKRQDDGALQGVSAAQSERLREDILSDFSGLIKNYAPAAQFVKANPNATPEELLKGLTDIARDLAGYKQNQAGKWNKEHGDDEQREAADFGTP